MFLNLSLVTLASLLSGAAAAEVTGTAASTQSGDCATLLTIWKSLSGPQSDITNGCAIPGVSYTPAGRAMEMFVNEQKSAETCSLTYYSKWTALDLNGTIPAEIGNLTDLAVL
jgi:hypothetical protein